MWDVAGNGPFTQPQWLTGAKVTINPADSQGRRAGLPAAALFYCAFRSRASQSFASHHAQT